MPCSVADCPNPIGVPGSAGGLCRAHYKRRQKYGSEHEPHRKVHSWAGEKCAEGCGKDVVTNGLCVNHYAVARRRNNPEAQAVRNRAWKERRNAELEQLMGRPKPDCCELCGEHKSSKYGHKFAGLVFDHDHLTSEPRGWLCDRCNKVLGLIEDNHSLLERMGEYLKYSPWRIEQIKELWWLYEFNG